MDYHQHLSQQIPFASDVADTSAGQSHENDNAALVIVCAPSALSKMMGSLHPAGALYEKPVNIHKAREAHTELVRMMRRRGVQVRDVRDILTERVDWSVGDRVALEELAVKCLKYVFDNKEESDGDCETCHPNSNGDSAAKTRTSAEEYYVSDQYKRSVIEEMGQQQLVDIIFTNPTVTVSPSTRDTGFMASYQFKPLSNIVFVRDQQITTHKGIVMARLRSLQRQREVDIMEFCFKKLGLNVIGRVPEPGHLEGGDFFPAGPELAFVGVGPRSDWPAIEYLLKEDLFGTEAVAVVRDELEKKQERMHLDTVFNLLNSTCCIMLEEMMGENSSTKRVVDEYVRSDSPLLDVTKVENVIQVGGYRLRQERVEFSAYLKQRGFSIIPVSGEEQLNYGCNILNLGNGDVISIEKNTARRIATSPKFEGTVEFLDFTPVTCMYGGVHCATQVVARTNDNKSGAD